MEKLKLLIIGGTGFIGSQLVNELNKKGHQIRVLSRNGARKNDCYKQVEYIEGSVGDKQIISSVINDIDYVYYFATTTNPKQSEKDLISDLSSNLIPIVNVLYQCVNKGIKKFIFCSSGGTVYGNQNKIPINEKSLCNPISSYGLVKLSIENYIKYFNHKYNLNYEILRLSNPYGANQFTDGTFGIIPTYIHAILSDKLISVYGEGEIVRDYIYIDDFISLNLKLLTTTTKNNIINVGTGIGTSIKELIHKIEIISGKKANVQYLPKRNFDVSVNCLEIKKVQKIYNWKPTISLDEGIKKTLEQIKSV
jgi:UDP-glucose 4-epimerase